MKKMNCGLLATVVALSLGNMAMADSWTGSLSDWQSAGTVSVSSAGAQVDFTYVSSANFVAGTTVLITDDVVPGLYTVELSRAGGTSIVAAGDTGDLQYTVYSAIGFHTAELDVTHVGASSDVHKYINGSYDLHSVNGSSDHADLNCPTVLNVHDTVLVGSLSAVTNLQNSYTVCPEPSGIVISAMAMLGCVAMMYRRKKMTAPVSA
ncbi:MAG: hypothetical protein JSS02_33390 [Planctomycetes bacterium]|nr:hypothetical protein [Planctomycetota bacterium]